MYRSMRMATLDHDDLERLLLARNPRFQAIMAQAEESIKTGKTLSSDEFWRQAYARADARAPGQAAVPSPSTAPAIAEPRVEYQTDE
jgi:hypothetical protein